MSLTAALNDIECINNIELNSIVQSPPSTILQQPLTISKIQLYSSYDDEYYDITNQNNTNSINNANYLLTSSKHIASSTSSLNFNNNPVTNSWSDLNNNYYINANNKHNKSQSSFNSFKSETPRKENFNAKKNNNIKFSKAINYYYYSSSSPSIISCASRTTSPLLLKNANKSSTELAGLLVNAKKINLVLSKQRPKSTSSLAAVKNQQNNRTPIQNLTSSNTPQLIRNNYNKKNLPQKIGKKIESDKMKRFENEVFQMNQPVIDLELKAYVKQKKQINEKIQNHWKLELNTHSLEKGQPINKINDEMFKQEQSWITILNTNSTKSHDNFNNSNTNRSSYNPNDSICNLIDTFTGSINGNQKSDKVDTYRVKSEIGTMIAQKLVKGDKIRVCRNGEPVNFGNDSESEAFFSESKFLSNTKKSNYEYLPHLIENDPNNFVLSWKDQVKNDKVKIIEPKVVAQKEEKIEKPKRNLIVKKLIDEDEYKPIIKKSPLEDKELVESLKDSSIHYYPLIKKPDRNMTVANIKLPVQIVGVSTNTSITSLLNQNQHQNLNNSNNESINNNNASIKSASNADFEFNLGSTLVPASKTDKSNMKIADALNEKNYLQIIDNLTNRYNLGDTSKESNKISHNKKKNKVKYNQETLIKSDIINNLTLNNNTDSSTIASLTSNYINDKKLINALEKKYLKNLFKNDSSIIAPSSVMSTHSAKNRENLNISNNNNSINYNNNNNNLSQLSCHPSNNISSQSQSYKEISPIIFQNKNSNNSPVVSSLNNRIDNIINNHRKSASNNNSKSLNNLNNQARLQYHHPQHQNPPNFIINNKTGQNNMKNNYQFNEHITYLQMVKPISPLSRNFTLKNLNDNSEYMILKMPSTPTPTLAFR